jgi:predicted ATPase
MTKTLVAGALVLAMATMATPALAEQEFFVAFDTTANQCRVMMTQPDGTVLKKIGDAYPTIDEAQEAIETLPECAS